jgi:DNA-binding MarR family transcriptional regulator
MTSKKPESAQKGHAATAQTGIPAKAPRKTKQSLLLDLISREGGASLQELASATGWLPHTTRAAITGLRKRGHDVKRQRVDGITRYMRGSGGK